MLQLDILDGTGLGTHVVVRRFPFEIGRAADRDLVLPRPGVWERHARLTCSVSEGFFIEAVQGLVSVDGRNARRARLRGGARVEMGSVKIKCGLSPSRQRRFQTRESVVWLALLGLAAVQMLAVCLWLP